LKNPGGAGGWAVIIKQNGCVQEYSGGETDTTNNRMELRAAIEGLKVLKTGSDVYLYTDSRYVRDGVRWRVGWEKNGWKTKEGNPVKNADLWLELFQEVDRLVVSWLWVKGHNGDECNERCDELAGKAARAINCK
jgi:ribonuclease HI